VIELAIVHSWVVSEEVSRDAAERKSKCLACVLLDLRMYRPYDGRLLSSMLSSKRPARRRARIASVIEYSFFLLL
jgi:hypothetical protein